MTERKVQMEDGGTAYFMFCTGCGDVHILLSPLGIVLDWNPVDGIALSDGSPDVRIPRRQLIPFANHALQVWRRAEIAARRQTKESLNQQLDTLVKREIRKANDQ